MRPQDPARGWSGAHGNSSGSAEFNRLPLLLWALLIVLVVGLGFATLFVGLVVTVPVVGHATWHAYRELVATQ
jgi:uncharacterized membrane protein